jgi:hypothetical protein
MMRAKIKDQSGLVLELIADSPDDVPDSAFSPHESMASWAQDMIDRKLTVAQIISQTGNAYSPTEVEWS